MHGGSPGGLHQDQRQSEESQTSGSEEVVLPGQTGNWHTAQWTQLWQEFNILNLLPTIPHKLNLRLNLRNCKINSVYNTTFHHWGGFNVTFYCCLIKVMWCEVNALLGCILTGSITYQTVYYYTIHRPDPDTLYQTIYCFSIKLVAISASFSWNKLSFYISVS